MRPLHKHAHAVCAWTSEASRYPAEPVFDDAISGHVIVNAWLSNAWLSYGDGPHASSPLHMSPTTVQQER